MTMRRRQRENDRRQCRCSRRHKISLVILCWCFVSIHAQQQQQQQQQQQEQAPTGILDTLWKFQESLRSQVEGTTDIPTPPSPKNEKRRVTHRRGFFEHTLQRHYSKFLPDDIPPPENVQRSIQPSVKESWIDAKSGCALFQEDGTAYWTYHWCPKSYITQVHLAPAKMENGAVIEYKATNVNKLGTYEDIDSTASTYQWTGIIDGENAELYTDGDYCYPSHDKRLRTKTKRRTAVVFELCHTVNEPTIVKVIETTPCQYVVRVCMVPEEAIEEEEPDTIIESLEDDSVEEVDHLDIVEDIQRVTSAYAKTTGVDQADMEQADRATSLHDALPPFPPSRRKANLDLVREMFTHSYDSYMYNAYPASEVKPLTCRPGTFDLVKLPALTLIDTLDTLAIMRNFTEFSRGVERLRDLHKSMQEVEYQGKTTHILGGGLFSTNQNVSLFETNIRVMGGLLSAHQLAVAYLENQVPKEHVRDIKGGVLIGPIIEVERTTTQTVAGQEEETCSTLEKTVEQEVCKITNTLSYTRGGKQVVDKCENTTESGSASSIYWTYDGFLLDLAHDLGKRMVPAFQTKTGIPYGTVNLVDGIPNGESKVASLAGAGTLTLEFELLSRLTGDESFGNEAKLASRALWMRRSKKDLLGKHINIERGGWTETLSGIGSNSDSFYEYLVKHYILFPEDADFWPMFLTSYYGVHNESRIGEWYADVDMNTGSEGASRRVFESLMAFYPGMQVLVGELSPAAKTLNGFFMVREAVGLLPERFNYGGWKVDGSGAGLHPLRPELLESCYFLHKSTEGVSSKRTNHSRVDGHSGWLWAADYALHTIHWHTWAPCGYSAVSGVSPQTTGGIPGSQAKNQRPKAVNEMPSFFLSETLKYLFLTFDEDNLLHQDDDRQWVFTTEAHPIHHEPSVHQSSAESGTESAKLRQRVRDLLKNRAKGPSSKFREKSNSWSHGTTEKWAERSSEADFMKQMLETEAITMDSNNGQPPIARKGQELFKMDILQPSFLPIATSSEDELSSSKQDIDNIAHLSLAPAGVGTQTMAITKACANICSQSLSWVNALNGGATDYANVYVSSVHDEIPVDTRYEVGLMSASHALALYGSGLFLGKNPASTANSSPTSTHNTAKKEQSNPGTQRFDMGGDLGEFEVSVYAEGNGFYIKQINSGESVIATVVHDYRTSTEEDHNTSPYVMIQATTPPRSKKRPVAKKSSQSWLPGMSWKSVFTREESDATDDPGISVQESKTVRSVLIGDASGAAFLCELQIVKRTNVDSNPLDQSEEGNYSIETEQILKTFPCAPGLFGPTRVPHLTKTKGVTMEGKLVAPSRENEDGCADIDETIEAAVENQIHLVKRGSCTFQDKARNQNRRGANAVVVINSHPSELFLMAPGINKDSDGNDFLVSALVSGSDGAELLKLIDESSPESVFAKVVVAPQSITIDENGTVQPLDGSSDLRFPILQASSENIQIFASGGWGVQAMERPIDQPTTNGSEELKKEWQLFLMQHSQVSDT